MVENNSEYAKECFMGLWKYIPQDQPSLRAQVRENIKVRSVTPRRCATQAGRLPIPLPLRWALLPPACLRSPPNRAV